MGWNRIQVTRPEPLLAGLNGAYFYFVHSYAVPPSAYTAATCRYGAAFSAAVTWRNFSGCSFTLSGQGPLGRGC
ncbi:hypothetical protein [Deinococcus lacus]